MPSLYTLTQEAQYLQELLDTDMITEEIYRDSIESLLISDKVDNVCKMIRNYENAAKQIKDEKAKLDAKQKACENHAARLKQSLLDHMLITNKAELSAGVFKVSRGQSKSYAVEDASKLPGSVFESVPMKVSMAKLKSLCEDSGVPDGVQEVRKDFVKIR